MVAIPHYRVVDALPDPAAPNAIYYVKRWRGYDIVITDTNAQPLKSNDRYFPVNWGGQFLLDPNEINGWGVVGFVDDTNNQDLADADATTLTRISGGLRFPFDVRLLRFDVWHRNNSAEAEAWGWVIGKQMKVDASTTQTSTIFLHEVNDNGGVGPRDYGDTINHHTDIDLSNNADAVITAGEVIVVGVASPTAVAENRYVQVMTGLLELERL